MAIAAGHRLNPAYGLEWPVRESWLSNFKLTVFEQLYDNLNVENTHSYPSNSELTSCLFPPFEHGNAMLQPNVSHHVI